MGLGDLGDEKEYGEEEQQEEESDVVEVQSQTSDLPDTPEAEQGLIQPVDELEEVARLYEQFESIKKDLLAEGDTTTIGDNEHINKSGWRKIATAFNISVETIEDEMWVEDGIVKAKVKAVATAPNGKSATGVGLCASNESNHMEAGTPKSEEPQEHPDYFHIDGKWRRLKEPREVSEHNILATAATRAKNRAISDCVGGGEVSAEEIQSKEDAFEDIG